MKKYVLTGGPGSGKSSILKCLEIRHGEHIVRECPQDYIELRQAEGQPEPWKDPNFQESLFQLQLQRNQRIPKDAKRVFLDRDTPDYLAYTEEGELYERVLAAARAQKWDAVFLVENLGQTEKTTFRRESQEEALRVERKLAEIYRGLGYEPIRICAGVLSERVEKILGAIK